MENNNKWNVQFCIQRYGCNYFLSFYLKKKISDTIRYAQTSNQFPNIFHLTVCVDQIGTYKWIGENWHGRINRVWLRIDIIKRWGRKGRKLLSFRNTKTTIQRLLLSKGKSFSHSFIDYRFMRSVNMRKLIRCRTKMMTLNNDWKKSCWAETITGNYLFNHKSITYKSTAQLINLCEIGSTNHVERFCFPLSPFMFRFFFIVESVLYVLLGGYM